jgi:Cu(I)/Ag(I) efflux system membrane protein CusA/SilA
MGWFPLGGFVLLALGLNGVMVALARDGKMGSKVIGQFFLQYGRFITVGIVTVAVSWILGDAWRPLGVSNGAVANFLFVLLVVGLVLGVFKVFIAFYPRLLGWGLENKKTFLVFPVVMILCGGVIWQGFDRILGMVPNALGDVGISIRKTTVWSTLTHAFPGMGKEFMPALDEGAFLLMPTSMPHSGVDANRRYLQQIDMRVQAIPEVEMVVGKAGRVASALDPAPVSMFENVILYKSEYKTDINGYPIRFRVDQSGDYVRDDQGNYIPDEEGEYVRQWRDHIQSPNDIWNEIVNATNDIPGLTSAPKLQPIETRLVMLQTGMRAPMGIKVYGPDLKSIEAFGLQLETVLKQVPSVKPEAVFADRSLGKPYLEIELNRQAMGRYGLTVDDVQQVIEVAIGGMPLTTTVEGRERFAIRARYAREWRDDPEKMKRILISTASGEQILLGDVTAIVYRPGPMMIRGENTFLVGYVLLDKKDGFAEVTVIEDAQRSIEAKIASGELVVPPNVSYQFSGSYENQLRAEKRLGIVVPLVLAVIFLILYFQFRSVSTALMIFSAIALAFSGGFMMLWLYGQDWFMNFSFMGTHMRTLFQMHPFNLSVAVWVGFIALFGIATDDGVLIATYLKQSFDAHQPTTVAEVRKTVLVAGMKRVRPCLMTTATTLLALLPVLTSSGRGADIMIPMAIPAFGGMAVALITLFVVPVLYAAKAEWQVKKQ